MSELHDTTRTKRGDSAFAYLPQTTARFIIKSLIRKSLHAVQKDRRAVFDMAVSAALQFFSMAIGLATTAILTRTLSSGDIGFCALIMSIVGIGGALTDFGIGKLAVRYAAVAHHENDKNGLKAIFRWIFRLRFSLAVVAFSALYFCASYLCSVVWHEPMLSPILRLGLFNSFFITVSAVSLLYFQTIRKFGVLALLRIAPVVLNLTAVICLASVKHLNLVNLELIKHLWLWDLKARSPAKATCLRADTHRQAGPPKPLKNTFDYSTYQLPITCREPKGRTNGFMST